MKIFSIFTKIDAQWIGEANDFYFNSEMDIMLNTWAYRQAEHSKNTLISFYIGTLATTAAIYTLAFNDGPYFLNQWFIYMVVTSTFTFFKIIIDFKKVKNNLMSPDRLISNYRNLLFIVWAGWSYVSLYLFSHSSITVQAFIAIIYTGVTAACIPIHLLTKNAILYPLFYALLIPLSIGSLLTFSPFGYLISALCLFYLLTLIRATSHLYKIIINEFKLANKNQKLLKEVEDKSTTLVANAKKALLGEVAGGMAHEINNPLAYILSSLELMRLKQNITPEDLDKTINKIHVHINRISRIIKGLTYFSKQNVHDFFMLENLEDLISRTINLKKDTLKTLGINIIFKVPKHIEIECNPFDFSLALLNLINNSQEALIELPRRWIKIEAEEYWSNSVIIKVTDSGLGIKAEVREKIMSPFFTTKNPTHATGMGLSIALGIFKSHGGDLSLDTQSPNTSFIIHLPIKQKQRNDSLSINEVI